jgi:hypothetical protein
MQLWIYSEAFIISIKRSMGKRRHSSKDGETGFRFLKTAHVEKWIHEGLSVVDDVSIFILSSSYYKALSIGVGGTVKRPNSLSN